MQCRMEAVHQHLSYGNCPITHQGIGGFFLLLRLISFHFIFFPVLSLLLLFFEKYCAGKVTGWKVREVENENQERKKMKLSWVRFRMRQVGRALLLKEGCGTRVTGDAGLAVSVLALPGV